MTNEEKEKLRLQAIAMSLIKGYAVTYCIFGVGGFMTCINCGGKIYFCQDGFATCEKCNARAIMG